MPNRLAHETSPYLLQHAHNPVDWYPWSAEALQKAKTQDKPILLSIGYSACHWCHVMAHESFEDPETAQLMNQLFINIKVDRQERPDLDAIYMQAVQAMAGRGGWPMTVFLTPDLVPFYGGTYFPPTPRYGMPAFRQVLTAVAAAYRERRDEITQSAQRLLEHLKRPALSPAQGHLNVETLTAAHHALARQFDPLHGGFGGAPKFPPAMVLAFLLRLHHRAGWAKAWEMVTGTLTNMALGGIYDQLGGGFHRYSVDERWLVPHFEKMLYDNALLSRVYLHAYQAGGDPLYRRVVEETLDYLLREMVTPEGGFCSAQDADSEGQEGKHFLWASDEVDALLGETDGPLVRAYLDITPQGNWEGRNILHIGHSIEQLAAQMDVSPAQLERAVERGRKALFAAREQRIKPACDDQVLTAWNGLTIASLAEAGAVLTRPHYIQAAVRAAEMLWTHLRTPDGRLLRAYRNGQARHDAYLQDHAYLAEGLLSLYQATFDPRWLDAARALTDDMLARFWDEADGGFFDTASDHADPTLIMRPKDLTDDVLPSANAVAATVMLQLAALLGPPVGETYRQRARETLQAMGEGPARYPRAFGQALCALDAYLSAPLEIAIVGAPQDPATQALLAAVHSHYLPNKVLALAPPDRVETLSQRIPLLAGRASLGGQPTAYVCQNFACQRPVTEPRALAQQLNPAT